MTTGNYFAYYVYDWTDTYANVEGGTGTFRDKIDLQEKWARLMKKYDLSPHEYSLYVSLIMVIENGVRSKKLEKELYHLGEELIIQHEKKTGKKVNDW